MSKPIKNIADIDTTTFAGRMLVAAITLLSAESLVAKSYDQIIADCAERANEMYGEIKEPSPVPAY